MLRDVNEIETDIGQRFTWALWHRLAVDPETGIYLTCSRARRKTGRPTRWYVQVPLSKEDQWGERAFGFTSWTFEEALQTANQKLEKWLAKGLVWNKEQYKWMPPEKEAIHE